MSAKVISICIQKGGSGKTTTASSLAAGLAERGQSVLMIDLDPQANLSEIWGQQNQAESIYPLLIEVVNGNSPDVSAYIRPVREHLSMLPAHIDLAAGEIQFSAAMSRETLLKRLISPVIDDYDVILIDTPPSVGIFTINALVASDYYLVPVETEYLALKGLDILVNTVAMIGQTFKPDLQMLGVLINKFDARKVICRNIEELIRARFGAGVFTHKVRDNVALVEAQASHQSIFEYNKRSYAAEDFGAITEEVLERLGK
ncbi:MAG: ParA family protein [Bacteroidota bacterium]